MSNPPYPTKPTGLCDSVASRWDANAPKEGYPAASSPSHRQAGLTQRDLAERLGKPPSFVAKIETGERRLDLVEFVAIARALNLSPAEFIGRVDAAMPGKIEI